MQKSIRILFIQLFTIYFSLSSLAQSKNTIHHWLTHPKKAILFKEQPIQFFGVTDELKVNPIITIDETIKYQTIDGFGFALTDVGHTHFSFNK